MLTQSVAITIPSRDRRGNVVPADDRNDTLHIVRRLMADRFGGFTELPGIGGWKDDSGRVITESVAVLRSWAESIGPADVDWLRGVASEVAEELNQACVAIETPAGLDFIAPNPFVFTVA